MNTLDNFSIPCNQCGKQVVSFDQHIHYTLTESSAVQGSQGLELSCGCVVDFPSWDIDLNTGWCQISNYAGTIFLQFFDEELLNDEGDYE